MYAGDDPPEPPVRSSTFDGETHARTVNSIVAILALREEWMEQLAKRSRTVERDIEAWTAQCVAQVAADPWSEFHRNPPTSMFDVEPPF